MRRVTKRCTRSWCARPPWLGCRAPRRTAEAAEGPPWPMSTARGKRPGVDCGGYKLADMYRAVVADARANPNPLSLGGPWPLAR